MSDSKNSKLVDLTSLIPGYSGYQNLESRRADDRATRTFLAKRLQEVKSALDVLGRNAINSGDLNTPLLVDSIRNQVDRARGRVNAAVEGYASWFSERKVDEAVLTKVSQLDSNLVSLVDQLAAMIQTAIDGAQPLDEAQVREAIDLLHTRLDRRKEILLG